jgi:hypothetical protein
MSKLVITFLVTPDEGPSLETSKFPLYIFRNSCIPTNESLFIFLYTLYNETVFE